MNSDMSEWWWDLAGPASVLDRLLKEISKSERVIAFEAPSPRPDGLAAAFSRRLGRELALDCLQLDLSHVDQDGSIAHILGEAADVPAAEIATISDFATHSALVGMVILIDGINPDHVRRWGLFLRSLANEKVEGAIGGPIVVVYLPPGITRSDKVTLCGSASVISTQGTVDRHDTIAYLARVSVRPGCDLISRIGRAVVIDVAAWSRPMLESMAAWKVEDQVDPFALLYRLADGSNFASRGFVGRRGRCPSHRCS
jgi:hypothetical protein